MDYNQREKRIILTVGLFTKILKLNENNKHGFPMTKPMSVGSIKEKRPDSVECHLLLEKVTLDDKIGHLSIVDIEFDYENVDAKQIMYNEIYPPVIDKQKKIGANKRSIFQLCELNSETTGKEPNWYRTTKKSKAILISKKCIPRYLDHLKFLISRYGWKVTKLYSHFTFQQSKFKKDFISMNQKSWQTAKNAIEKDFYKLLNNAIYDEIGEFTYIRKYHNLFDNEVSKFVNSSLIEKEIEKTYNEKLLQTNDDNFLKISKIEYLKTEKKKKIKKKKWRSFTSITAKRKKKHTHKENNKNIGKKIRWSK